MDAVNFIDNITQQITVDHTVLYAMEDGGDNITPVTPIDTLQIFQVSKQAGASACIRAYGFIVIDKGNQLITGNATLYCCPVTPTVGWLDSRLETPAFQGGFSFTQLFQIVQKLEKHDPGEHGQAIQITVESFVLAHDLASRLDNGTQLLCGGHGLFCFFLSWHSVSIL